jgi:serine/threonine protein kinase
MLDQNTLQFIGKVFIGDIEKFYNYKKGPEIYSFFNKYFGYNDKYWGQQQPSRWVMALNKLVDISNNNKLNKFFSITLGLAYLHLEYPEMTNDELASHKNEIIKYYNSYLKTEGLKLLDSGGSINLININEDLEFIGAGGFAEVYKIKSKNLILKKLKEETYINKGIVSRFKREFTITKSLSEYDGAINVFQYDEHDISYTMELAEMDLQKYVTSNTLSFDTKLIIIYQILDVMKKVHLRDIVHRDISPSNILLFNGLFKIADFGLGKDLSIFSSHQTVNTNSYGQYFYCDPKQFMRLKDGDKSSDIYSIGKVINFIFKKDPNDTNHEFKAVTEKATASSDLARYKSVDEIETAIQLLVKLIRSSDYEKEVLSKIKSNICDESVITYVNGLDSEKLFLNLQNTSFRKLFLQIFGQYDNQENQFNKLNEIYDEMKNYKNKKFKDLDAIGLLAIEVLKGRFEFFIKEAAVDILNYIIGCNRWDIMKQTKDLVSSGIDPLLEDKLHTEMLKEY